MLQGFENPGGASAEESPNFCKVYSQSRQNGRPWWPDTKMAVFFKSQNLFFIIYIKLSREFGQVLMYKAAKMAGNPVNVNSFEGLFGHLNSN